MFKNNLKSQMMINPSPKDIFMLIENHIRGAEEYTYIILGKQGPTGKTWLCDHLRNADYRAFEISMDINNLVNYTDDKNHYIIDGIEKTITIILNRRLENM